ncbi:hypothetical protein PPUN15366_26190 [Pseudomonas putida]|uniref:hypothetical protein n=1 Tax=Pseudomonas putida TaxID=303 RepID=UPI00235BE980|nr:hypothetical protein [Pseudomonas putida]GLO40974.1 hypothetical protein PPUN15366_26190 [Pseudomonas putida]HDS0975874.1 hypothetical protein [Pseudomonas putida]
MAGIKMTHAFDQNGVKWAADDYSKGIGVEPLICERCDAAVSHVGSFTRNCYDNPSKVSAFFRLHANGTHGPNCRFGVDKQIIELASTSDGLVESIQKNRFRMRLVAVTEELKTSARRVKEDDSADRPPTASKSYTPSSNRLSSYINTAQRVLRLRAMCDGDADIEQHLELVFAGNTVGWHQFYFEHARQMEAHYAVSQSASQYPIAIHGRVGKIKLGVKDDPKLNVLNLERLRVTQDPSDPTNGISLEVSVWTSKASWFDSLKENDEVIVFGLWKAPTPAQTKAAKDGFFKTFTNRRLTMTLAVKSQIAKV